MKKTSLCLAGLITLLFSPPALALTQGADRQMQNQGMSQNLVIQNSVPFQTAPNRPAVNQWNDRFVDQKSNSSVNNGAIDSEPFNPSESDDFRADDFRAELPSVPPAASRQQAPPPSFTEASSAAALAAETAADRFQSSSAAFGAVPIQSQLGVEFDLSNSAQPLPPPVSSAQPVQSKPSVQIVPPVQPKPAVEVQQQAKHQPEFTLKDLFTGDSDSVVAVTVGNAEGTRQPNGQPNQAFYGHSDPGNGVWNMGTFSFQHGADSPEEADAKQINRLKRQAQVMQQKAADQGLKLTLEETLNGIDLANQAPQAVIDSQGYIDWLVKAHASGLKGADAILWARVHSFIDPNTQQWNAPGLGNTRERITHDQQRRMKAIASALSAQDYAISPDARLRPQPIVFRIPGIIGMVRQLASSTVQWFGF